MRVTWTCKERPLSLQNPGSLVLVVKLMEVLGEISQSHMGEIKCAPIQCPVLDDFCHCPGRSP